MHGLFEIILISQRNVLGNYCHNNTLIVISIESVVSVPCVLTHALLATN